MTLEVHGDDFSAEGNGSQVLHLAAWFDENFKGEKVVLISLNPDDGRGG